MSTHREHTVLTLAALLTLGGCLSPGPDQPGEPTPQDELCKPAAEEACRSSDPCQVGRCDPATGSCVRKPAPDGTACDDGDACTVGDACQGGLCRGKPADACKGPTGSIHLSYAVAIVAMGELPPKNLRYAHGSLGDMRVEEVDHVNHGEMRSGLVLDRDDVPHLVWGRIFSAWEPEPGVALRYGVRTGGTWSLTTASRRPQNPALVPAITLDAAGRRLLSHQRDDAVMTGGYPPYQGPREVLVTEGRDGTWRDHGREQRPEWLIGEAHNFWWIGDTSVAITRENRGVLAYVRTLNLDGGVGLGPAAGSGLYLSREGAGGWAPSEAIALPHLRGGVGLLRVGKAQIALDRRDRWHIVFTTLRQIDDPAPHKCFIEYVRSQDVRNDGSYPTTQVAALTENTSGARGGGLVMCAEAPGSRAGIAIDQDRDIVHIAYWDNGIPVRDEQMGHFRDKGLWYARREPDEAGGRWTHTLVDPDGDEHDVSIALTPAGEPVIAYKSTSDNRPKLAALRGGTWRFDHVGSPDEVLVRLGDVAVAGVRGRGPVR